MLFWGIVVGDILFFAAGVLAAVAAPWVYRLGVMALGWLKRRF